MGNQPVSPNQQAQQPNRALANFNRVRALVKTEDVTERFGQVLGPDRARAFLASVLNAVATNDKLMECTPESVIQAAMTAALFDLPITKDLGYAWIIPYKGIAQFQMGAKGYLQLAHRTKEYLKVNYASIYEGETVKVNRITGDVNIDGEATSNKPIGFISYFKLLNGYEHYAYWTAEQMTAHAKKYSKSYNAPGSMWHTEFEKMGWKTILSYNLRKFGILSVTMRNAMAADEDTGLNEFFRNRGEGFEGDNEIANVIDGEFTEPPAQPEPFDPVAFLVENGICKNDHAAKGLLKSHVPAEVAADAERLLIWGNAYRERREAGDEPADAAMFAGTIIELGRE